MTVRSWYGSVVLLYVNFYVWCNFQSMTIQNQSKEYLTTSMLSDVRVFSAQLTIVHRGIKSSTNTSFTNTIPFQHVLDLLACGCIETTGYSTSF